MSTGPLFCVNIDLDDLRYYRGIHGLPPVADTPVLFSTAVPRFLELCAAAGCRATLFTIAEDLVWDEAVRGLREAVSTGHEIASHSRTHPYGLSLLSPDAMAEEVRAARRQLQEATGTEVAGFRAPGYNLTPSLLTAVVEAGHRYDSSILPSPPYYLARAAVIAGMALWGKRSASIVGRARDWLRSREPFDWKGLPLREYPITASGPARIPLIGTFLTGGWLTDHIVACAKDLQFVNVEFHGIDFLDVDRDGLDPALALEPALKVPFASRKLAFEEALRALGAGKRRVPLGEIAGLG